VVSIVDFRLKVGGFDASGPCHPVVSLHCLSPPRCITELINWRNTGGVTLICKILDLSTELIR